MTSDHSIIQRIRQLKKEKNVVILAHYYMPAELQIPHSEGGIADFVGDSLGLSLEAARTTAENILFCGVKFMAETALIVNPERKVYMPDVTAGCSLAASITGEDVRNLKAKYPGIPVMGYVNTNAETKAELDICCTSRNAVKIASSIENDKILFVPDYHMGQNLRKVIGEQCGKELILWNGTCEVHEQFRNELIHADEETEILMHWEVPGETVNEQLKSRKGMVGSTGDILNYVQQSQSKKFLVASECDLSVSLKRMNQDKEFITPCVVCKYMKQNQLQNTLEALESIGTPEGEKNRILLDAELIQKARIPVMKMLAFS